MTNKAKFTKVYFDVAPSASNGYKTSSILSHYTAADGRFKITSKGTVGYSRWWLVEDSKAELSGNQTEQGSLDDARDLITEMMRQAESDAAQRRFRERKGIPDPVDTRQLLKDKAAKEIAPLLVGKTIKSVRYMTDAEVKNSMWYAAALIIEFTDGSWIVPMADDEGNNAGAIWTSLDAPDDTIGVF